MVVVGFFCINVYSVYEDDYLSGILSVRVALQTSKTVYPLSLDL
ncbi:hypothetical protein HanRHA438_Chr07g0315461 [Helianthus annuus]|nr:hypothetical protein HanRHA438_Chr07g0315461 [Helianthus annuus]